MAATKGTKTTSTKAGAGRPGRTAEADGEEAVLEAIAAMPDWERAIGERLHAVIRESAPDLSAKLWYGQPAYARAGKGGKVVCFFRGAALDKERYVTFGFSSDANLDEGTMWPTAYALTALSADDEARIAALVTRAAS